MGPFMVEIVFCRVTRRGRKVKKGQNKGAITDSRNEGPAFKFLPAPQEETVKVKKVGEEKIRPHYVFIFIQRSRWIFPRTVPSSTPWTR